MKGKYLQLSSIRVLLVNLLITCPLTLFANGASNPETLPRSDAAVQADALFWQVFHGGEYDNIPLALDALTAAYLEDPNDPITAGHIGGGLHLWRVSEQARMHVIPPTITDHVVLARKYLEKSIQLDHRDARFLGQLGGMMMAEGAIHGDSKLIRRGSRNLNKSIRRFPEFNNFTGGYLASRLPPESRRFKRGLDLLWSNVDLCIGDKFDRTNPDMSPYMHLATTEGNKRVCWNGWVAPHNFEGFFLNMGDMLVKSGDWQTGKKIYANARLSPDYNWWKFSDVLEERIAQAQDNVARFNAPSDGSLGDFQPVMSQSAFACMACHQE